MCTFGPELIPFLLKGTVGVAVVTAGPGLTNTITAVKNAQMAESPLLLMGGAAATLLQVGAKLTPNYLHICCIYPGLSCSRHHHYHHF